MFTPLYLVLAVTFAACLHAGFQLGVSLLTVLSGHSLSKRRAHSRLLQLNAAYILGYLFMTLLLLATSIYFVSLLHLAHTFLFGLIVAGFNIAVGIWVVFFYYRHRTGTALWLPRSMARYLQERSLHTKSASESFVLGTASVLGELAFIAAPLLVGALYIARQPYGLRLPEIMGYTILSAIPLVIIFMAIGGGHRISSIQAWREKNKRFLQIVAGGGLVVLGVCLFAAEINNYILQGMI